jgi:hypothetical protein
MAQVVAGGGLTGGMYSRAEPRSRRAPRSASLWRPEDLLRWGAAVGLGSIVVAVAWYICAGEVSFSSQVGPTDAAVAGLLVAGIGNVGWLLKGRRALGERRSALLPDVRVLDTVDQGARGSHRPSEEVAQTDPRGLDLALGDMELCVGGEGMERFHRPECALTTGRHDWKAMSRGEHEAAGRSPCGVCRP